MEWVNLGYDFRTPLSKDSEWKVGDLGFDDFSELLDASHGKVQKIISFDFNLSPRPRSIEFNSPGNVEMAFGVYSSKDEAYTECKDVSHKEKGIFIFWQAEKKAYLNAKKESWFDFLPETDIVLPKNWLCAGIDIINDQSVSECWDPSEEFWEIDQRLISSVNQYGLITDEELVKEYLHLLPLNPFNKWVMPLRVWIPEA